MILYPGDIFNLDIELRISVRDVTEFEESDLKLYLQSCVNNYILFKRQKGDSDESKENES